MQDGVASNLRSATRGAMDVITLEGDGVLGASEVKSPVLVAIAGSRPVGCSINLVVGDGHTTGGGLAENNVLTTDQGSANVIYPDEVASFQRDGITTPNVLRVQLSNVDVLQDDILSTHNAKTFALDDTRRSRPD